jgi:diacylglycerol kinase family enzyme
MATYPDSLLILNGKSASNDILRQAVVDLREDGAHIHVRLTWEKGDAARYVAEGVQLGVNTIISGGGDGTINEIATA